MTDLRRELLNLLCLDEQSFAETRWIDTDRIDVLGEIDAAEREAREDGSWSDERRRKILERARTRALGGRAREEVARENVARFLEALSPTSRAVVEREAPQDGTLPDRIDRGLAGVATAIASTLPRALRRRGSATFAVRERDRAHHGGWTDVSAEPLTLALDGLVQLQFERMGELSPVAAAELSQELFRAVAGELVDVPGFTTKADGSGSFTLLWSSERGEGTVEERRRAVVEDGIESAGLEAIPEYVEVAAFVHTNFACARRDPAVILIHAFVPGADPATAVPSLVTELASRVDVCDSVVSGELVSLVEARIDTMCAKSSRGELTAGAREALEKALARLDDNRRILARLHTAGRSNGMRSSS